METVMYLLEDCTGAASRIEYGKKGDRVIRLKYDNWMSLVQGDKHLFHVRNEKLSIEPVEPDPEKTTSPPPPVKTPRSGKKKVFKQSNLFK